MFFVIITVTDHDIMYVDICPGIEIVREPGNYVTGKFSVNIFRFAMVSRVFPTSENSSHQIYFGYRATVTVNTSDFIDLLIHH